MRHRGTCARAVVLGLVGALACSGESPTAPPPPPRLLVTNPACAPGAPAPCRTLEVRAYVLDFTVPQPLSGFVLVGKVPGPSACLTFPASWTLTVAGPDEHGVERSTRLTWTPNGAVFLTVRDAGPLPTGAHGFFLGQTPMFVPSAARAWHVTVPAASDTPQDLAIVPAADACGP